VAGSPLDVNVHVFAPIDSVAFEVQSTFFIAVNSLWDVFTVKTEVVAALEARGAVVTTKVVATITFNNTRNMRAFLSIAALLSRLVLNLLQLPNKSCCGYVMANRVTAPFWVILGLAAMTDSERDSATSGAIASDAQRVSSLRGAEATKVGRGFWIVIESIGLVIFAVVVVISFLSAANDDARISRLKSHGIAVAITNVGCVGNLGGSGSNGSGYTCTGTYEVNGTKYREVIRSMTAYSSPTTAVRGVVDPSQHSSVELATSVKTSSSSLSVFIAPTLLALAFLVLTYAFRRFVRRGRSLRQGRTVGSRGP
jgi:hypothetical protein